MSLRYALIALLTGHPMTGYDLAKASESSVGFVWHAPNSQIYPELIKMEREGLLTSTEVAWGPSSTKKAYSVTKQGETAFRRWMNEPVDHVRARDPAHLKAAYFEWADPDAARAQLREHIMVHSTRIAQWRTIIASLTDRSNPTLAARLATHPVADGTRITAYRVFAYEGLIGQAQAQVRWAESGLTLIDTLEGDSPPLD